MLKNEQHQTLQNFNQSIPILVPKFTTPSLDYKQFAPKLSDYLKSLYSFKLHLQSLPKSETLNTKNQSLLLIAVYEYLEKFNSVTYPQRKKKDYEPKPLDLDTLTETDLDHISVHDFDPTLSNQQRSAYHYYRGAVLSIFDSYHLQAELDLCKAVKLNPNFTNAWKMLGECFWNKGDLEQAENCFRWILELHPDSKDILVLLSMVKRRQGNSSRELFESLELCKKALNLDPQFTDGWFGLGSTFMNLYFKVTRDIRDLQKALDAYDQAGNSKNPDLYYSRGIIHQYLEHCDASIKDLQIAASLDNHLEQRCKFTILQTKKYIRDIVKGIKKKADLSDSELEMFLGQFKYQKSILNEVLIQNLQEKNTKNNIRLLILRCANRYHDHTARTFICTDKSGSFCALTIFNIKPNILNVNDFVVLTNPSKVTIATEDPVPCVTIHDPRLICKGETRLGNDSLLAVEMGVTSNYI